jgi:hypothetical protein
MVVGLKASPKGLKTAISVVALTQDMTAKQLKKLGKNILVTDA